MTKTYRVVFRTEKTKKVYSKLKYGNISDRMLYKHITKAILEIEANPFCGIQIRHDQIPIKYKGLGSIYKYDLPRGWRLIYAVSRDEIDIFGIIIEWFDHKNYEKRFKYLI